MAAVRFCAEVKVVPTRRVAKALRPASDRKSKRLRAKTMRTQKSPKAQFVCNIQQNAVCDIDATLPPFGSEL